MAHFWVADLTLSLKTKWAAQPCINLWTKTLTFKIMITVNQKESCIVSPQRRPPLLESLQTFLPSCLFAKKSEKVLMRAWMLEKGRRRMSFLWWKANSLKPSHQSQREQVYPRVRPVIIIELFSTPLSPSPWLKRYSNTLLKSHLKKNTKSVPLSIVCRTRSINETILHVFHQPNRSNRGGRVI